jgi:hypothetical protein
MSSEIIQSVAYDNYDALQHVNFIFSQNFISLFWGLFNDEIHLRVRYMSWIVLEIKVPCIQWEGWACTHEGFNFFFASCSHKVISKFPKDSPSSQVVPQSVPNITSAWSLMVCPKFNSHVYKLKRWGSLKGGDHREKKHVCFYFATWGPQRCFYWEWPKFQKNWWWANQYDSFPK